MSGLDRWFEITRRGSTVAREIRGGLVTFFTMAYIIALNPLIIGTTADKNGNLITGAPMYSDVAKKTVDMVAEGRAIGMVAAATALIAGVMTFAMGAYARYPVGIATGLGLNAVVAYAIAPKMTWPQAMGLVVWEGLLITVLVMTNIRTMIFRAVPPALRTGISVGIGLFITFVGLMDAGIVRKPAGPTPVELGIGGSLQGWPLAICVGSFLLLIALYVKRVKGAMLISIVSATIVAVVAERIGHIGAVSDTHPTGWLLNVPKLSSFHAPNLGLIGRVDLFGAFAPNGKFQLSVVLGLLLMVLSLVMSDFFDTMGTVVAIGTEAGILDKQHNPPHLKEVLLVDALAAVAGGVGSVSSNTAYIESASGVGEGARTGLASVVTGLSFLLAIVVAPLVNMIPSEAAAPVLAFVGYLMMTQVIHVDWDLMEDAIPAFLTIVLMPFTYSITTGIGAGFIVYSLIKVFHGKAKQVHPLLWVVCGLFVIYFAQGLLMDAIGKL